MTPMNTLMSNIITLISNARLVLAAIIGLCIFALASALTAQYVFGLEPCILCIYQRWPFLVAAILAAIGLCLPNSRAKAGMLCACALTFAVNTAIAVFHVGVEQKWWRGTDACHLPDLSQAKTTEEYMALLAAAPSTPCDQIPWEIYGLSMAGMNVMFCFGMAVMCLLAAIFVVRKANGL